MPDLDRVLAEINHELGNYFHKLYYWADTVTDPDAGEGPSTEMLGRTLQGFEHFLRTAFGHFQPIELELSRMSVAAVASAIAQQLQPASSTADVQVTFHLADPERPLTLDPGRLSELVGVMVQRARSRCGRETGVALYADDRTEGGVAFRLLVTPTVATPLRGAQAVLDWAKARQLAELHGGRLWDVDDTDGYALTLLLPF